ncbi:MAG: UDP-N-acetylmuramoyl-L-alanyl-D-glutamate--2,6-diaminopimelate ligase, partial [Patescibacteria group bacterium]
MKNLIKNLKIKRRAVALLAAMHFYGNPSSKLKVIGVTGTNGKTTTVTLLYKIASILGHKSGLIGTVEYRIGDDVFPSTHTTPGPIALNKLMKKMVEAHCEYVFMEVSSHALDQGRVKGINFSGGVFTNLTHDHLDYHKSFKNYFLAKKKFFEMLPVKAFALSNADDEHGRNMVDKIKADAYFYGFDFDKKDNEFFGEILKMDFEGLRLKFDNKEIHSKLLGKFNAYNLFAVWSTCALLGFDMEKVSHILENIEPPTGRFEHFMSDKGVLVIVDYAHTPDALEKVLQTVKGIKPETGRIISV